MNRLKKAAIKAVFFLCMNHFSTMCCFLANDRKMFEIENIRRNSYRGERDDKEKDDWDWSPPCMRDVFVNRTFDSTSIS